MNFEKKNTLIIFEKYLYCSKIHLKAYLMYLLKLHTRFIIVLLLYILKLI